MTIDYGRALIGRYGDPDLLPLCERMVREGAWWDLVDGIAAWWVSPLYAAHRKTVRAVLDSWRRDESLWLRRAVLLAHLHHKEHTDEAALFADVRALMHEEAFFIRKAIGWALRQHSYVAPAAVAAFLTTHRRQLSGLSYREGAKVLRRQGMLGEDDPAGARRPARR